MAISCCDDLGVDTDHPGIADGNPSNLRHCTLPGCRRPFYARGLCNTDYQRWIREGRPDTFGPVPPRPRPERPLPASFRLFTG